MTIVEEDELIGEFNVGKAGEKSVRRWRCQLHVMTSMCAVVPPKTFNCGCSCLVKIIN